jgi:hypothetical protein
MICRCKKEYKMSWARWSIHCEVGKEYRYKLVGEDYIFLDFEFSHHYEGFPVPDLAFLEHFDDISEIREEKISKLLE